MTHHSVQQIYFMLLLNWYWYNLYSNLTANVNRQNFACQNAASALVRGPKEQEKCASIFMPVWFGSPPKDETHTKNMQSVNSHRQSSKKVRPIGFSLHGNLPIKRKHRRTRRDIFFTWEQKSQFWRAIDFPLPISVVSDIFPYFTGDQKSILDHPFNIKSGRCLYTQQTQFTLRFWSLSQQHQWPTSKKRCFSFNTTAKRFRIFMSSWEIQQNVIFSNSPSGSSVFIFINSGMEMFSVSY